MGLKSILAALSAIAARDPAQLQTWQRDYTLGPVPNRYKPHQGKREMARRVRQLRRGIIQRSALRFKVGEPAIWRGRTLPGQRGIPAGAEVIVIAVGPFEPNEARTPDGAWENRDRTDYLIDVGGRRRWAFCDEPSLEKRRPPIPDAVRSIFASKPAGRKVRQ